MFHLRFLPAPTRSSNEPQAPTHPADDARQLAERGRASPDRVASTPGETKRCSSGCRVKRKSPAGAGLATSDDFTSVYL
jgi:hypothetical protein